MRSTIFVWPKIETNSHLFETPPVAICILILLFPPITFCWLSS